MLALIAVASLNAQVRIGDTSLPNSFSALEIEGIDGGLRLPQLTEAQAVQVKNTIVAAAGGSATARGMLIYNTTSNRLEMWDGSSNNWVELTQGSSNTCSPPSSISITANKTTFTEFGADSLKLSVTATGASSNADIFYTWYRDTEPVGIGDTYVVPKEELASFYSGSYTVEAVSCVLSGTSTITSSAVTITVNKTSVITISPTTTTATYDQTGYVAFGLSGSNITIADLDIYIIEDKDRMYKSHNISSSTVNVEVNKSGNQNARIMKFQVTNGKGTVSDTITITQNAAQGTSLTGTSGQQYFLINSAVETSQLTYTAAIDLCRSLTWLDPAGKSRASLISEEFLEDVKGSITNSNISAGTYWLKGKSNAISDASLGSITYPSGFSMTIAGNATAGQTSFVRCVVVK